MNNKKLVGFKLFRRIKQQPLRQGVHKIEGSLEVLLA
jgi:hypothetical protein